jgi:hypothetical protein
MMFRLSRNIGNAQIPCFFINTVDAAGEQGASIEARVLLPLKTYAYGAPPHTCTDYFQMSVDLAKECCRYCDRAMKELYAEEYLRLPTLHDMKSITRLHEEKHSQACLGHWIVCIPRGRIAQRHGWLHMSVVMIQRKKSFSGVGSCGGLQYVVLACIFWICRVPE